MFKILILVCLIIKSHSWTWNDYPSPRGLDYWKCSVSSSFTSGRCKAPPLSKTRFKSLPDRLLHTILNNPIFDLITVTHFYIY